MSGYTRQIFSAPSKALLTLHSGLRRAASSIVVHLQTGKIVPSQRTLAPSEPWIQWTAHVARAVIQLSTSLPHALYTRPEGKTPSGRETDYQQILSQAALVRKFVQLMIATHLLSQFQGLP